MTWEQAQALKGWEPMDSAPKDGTLVLLVVNNREEANTEAVARKHAEGYVWSANALDDALYSRTVGHNNRDNDGEDRWQVAGWCWSHDHYTGGHGRPVLWRPLPAMPELEQLPRDLLAAGDEPSSAEGR